MFTPYQIKPNQTKSIKLQLQIKLINSSFVCLFVCINVYLFELKNCKSLSFMELPEDKSTIDLKYIAKIQKPVLLYLQLHQQLTQNIF